MEPFGVRLILLATTVSSLLALKAYKRKSLTPGGSIVAFIVAFLSVGSGLRGLNIYTFYYISMKATKYKVRRAFLCIDPTRILFLDRMEPRLP